MERIKKIANIVVVLVLLIGLLFLIISTWVHRDNTEKDLIENFAITEGKIVDANYPYKTSIAIFYEYYVNKEKIIKNIRTHCLSKKAAQKLIGLNFEVIYSQKHPENSVLLLFKSDYYKYNISPRRKFISDTMNRCK